LRASGIGPAEVAEPRRCDVSLACRCLCRAPLRGSSVECGWMRPIRRHFCWCCRRGLNCRRLSCRLCARTCLTGIGSSRRDYALVSPTGIDQVAVGFRSKHLRLLLANLEHLAKVLRRDGIAAARSRNHPLRSRYHLRDLRCCRQGNPQSIHTLLCTLYSPRLSTGRVWRHFLRLVPPR
jgi:hypothetical protein